MKILFKIKDGLLYLKNADGFRNKIYLGLYFLKNFLTQFIQDKKLNFSNPKIVKMKGIKLKFKPFSAELSPFKEIFIEEVYERIPLFVLENKKIIFDIGANIGLYSLKAAKNNKKCVVYAFEPNPYVFKRFLYNIKINGFEKKIHPFQKAVSSKNGIIKFRCKSHTTSSSFYDKKVKESGTILQIPMIKLDSFIEENKVPLIDILKIDAEGMEYEVLLGTVKNLGKVKGIVMEFHSQEILDKVNNLLEPRGFKRVLQIDTYIYFLKEK